MDPKSCYSNCLYFTSQYCGTFWHLNQSAISEKEIPMEMSPYQGDQTQEPCKLRKIQNGFIQ